jgi:fermentation-respiration switch protein FrsA (DUF1100 family)
LSRRKIAAPRRRRRVVVTGALLVASLAVVSNAGCADSLFYKPDARIYRSIEALGGREVSFRAGEDAPRLQGYWLEVPEDLPVRGTIVFCHGNSQNLTAHVPEVAWLPARGWRVLLFDYRGYGRSEGRTTRAGTVADACAAIDLALARDPERTVVYGHSLGGAIGLVATARRPAVRGIVAEATFPSYRAVAAAKVPPGLGWLAWLLVSGGEDPEDALAAIPPRPLLVVHGTADPIVPFRLGERLYDDALEPKALHVVEGGRHGSPWHVQRRQFEQVLLTFFAESVGERPR